MATCLLFELSLGSIHFALAFLTGFLKMTVFTQVGKYPGLLAFFLELFQGLFKGLAFIDINFRHATTSLEEFPVSRTTTKLKNN